MTRTPMEHPGNPAQRGRLLILDDDAAIGRTMQLVAESAWMEVRFTTRSAEFLEAVRTWQPTHISLDLAMPDMDGVQVLGRLGELNCRASIIIASGVGTRVLDAARRSATEHGLHIVGVLAKPFPAQALRTLLEGAHAPPDTRDAGAQARIGKEPPRAGFTVTEAELRRAIDEHQLELAYQPKIHCANGALAGFEAMVRWQHPLHGTIMPDAFVPFAEAHGLIDALTAQVVEIGLGWFGDFIAAVAGTAAPAGSDITEAISLSINISARMPKDLQFIDHILERCNQLAIDPARLTFELTETSAMDDAATSLDMLTRLRVKGFQLSLDDFGTGYSSMVQLVRLPFSEIKVDKSFVMTAMQSQESRDVVKSIVDLGHSLGLDVTAEGVESAEVLAYLRAIGCDLAQGYFIASPMPAGQIPAWIARHRG